MDDWIGRTAQFAHCFLAARQIVLLQVHGFHTVFICACQFLYDGSQLLYLLLSFEQPQLNFPLLSTTPIKQPLSFLQINGDLLPIALEHSLL